jgi:ribonuclease P protein component
VLVGRRAALHRDFTTMLDDLRQALLRLDRQPAKVAKALPRQDNASNDTE